MPGFYFPFEIVNYLKTAFRNFRRNRIYTLLNLAGLSIGFAAFILTAVYVYFESHFEDFHHNEDRIYRATYRFTQDASYEVHWARIPFTHINELPDDVAGIKTLIRFQNHERKYMRVGNEKFRPNHGYVTDKEVFDVFDFNLIAGDPSTALANPRSIVISQSLAAKYFGDADPVGQEIYVIGDLDEAETLHHITGVMNDLPANTHLPVEMLISFENEAERSGWAYTYVLLDNGADIQQIEREIPSFIRKHSQTQEDAKRDAILFQPVGDIHLHSDLAREIVPGGNVFYMQMAAFAGIFILILAVINFTNLNSAMALGRAKEIGMRKIMGASRSRLTASLLTESVSRFIAAAAIGSVIAYFTFPSFQDFLNVEFLPHPFWFAAGVFVLAIVAGLISGIYPVVLLTSVKPKDVVKTSRALSFAGKESPFSLKRVMVTVQFCVSILLLGSALIAYDQFRYLSTKDSGMVREQIVAIPGVPDKVKEGFTGFRNQLSQIPGVVGVSACMEVPSREIRDAGPVLVEGVNSDFNKAPVMDIQIIDHQFANLVELEFAAGTNVPPPPKAGQLPEFSQEFSIQQYLLEQPRHYLINETAMRQLGWQSPEEALGQRISWSIGDMALAYGPVTGVVRDFHQETLKNTVDPLVMVEEPVWLRTFLIKVETQNIAETIQSIQSTWDKLFPYYPLEYHFLDELYENLYKGERVQLQLLFLFSGLAIVIAFVGLVGLVAYALNTRTRELAVRKVLGASTRDLIRLMSREYIVVLLIGSLIAIPVSLYGIRQWLSAFAYRVDISASRYILSILFVLILLLVTIGWQTFWSSRMNVSETLRDD